LVACVSAPSLYGIFPYAGLKFYFYEEMKRHVPPEHKQDISLKLVCGSVAGLLGQTLTYPLDVVRRQMQVWSGSSSIESKTSLNLHKMILSSIITETPCRLRDYIQPLRKKQEEEQCKPFSRLQEKKVGSNSSQGLASITLRFETSFIDLSLFSDNEQPSYKHFSFRVSLGCTVCGNRIHSVWYYEAALKSPASRGTWGRSCDDTKKESFHLILRSTIWSDSLWCLKPHIIILDCTFHFLVEETEANTPPYKQCQNPNWKL
jgi:hypothetical protein